MTPDMTGDQRKAARGILLSYPSMKVEIARGEGSCTLTPYLAADPTQRGASVTVVYEATEPRQITREFSQSCADLMEQP